MRSNETWAVVLFVLSFLLFAPDCRAATPSGDKPTVRIPADGMRRLDVNFNNQITLLGYTITPEKRLNPGDTCTLTWYWRLDKHLEDKWNRFVHITSDGNYIVQNIQNVGDVHAKNPPGKWKVGKLVRDKQVFTLSKNAVVTRITIVTGFYKKGGRLHILKGKSNGKHAAIGPVLETGLTGSRAQDYADGEIRKGLGLAIAKVARPKRFPHRIWAACDFEARLPKYGWFGPTDKKNIPAYPGNRTALRAHDKPYRKVCARMTGINPVPGPCMGEVNHMYCRYFITGTDQARFQHYSLTRSDNNFINVSGLKEGVWSEVTLNFTRDARRNDGSEEAFKKGERMDDLKVFVGNATDGRKYQLILDDIIFFSTDPKIAPEKEPFPNRVMYVAGFDTGTRPKQDPNDKPDKGPYLFYPGHLKIVNENLPTDSYWSVAEAIAEKQRKDKRIRLLVDPAKPVGTRTKLRFRYYVEGTREMSVSLFDSTDGINRTIQIQDLKQKEWRFLILDFTKNAKTGSNEKPLAAGNKVSDISFRIRPGEEKGARLLIDEVVLFDAGK